MNSGAASQSAEKLSYVPQCLPLNGFRLLLGCVKNDHHRGGRTQRLSMEHSCLCGRLFQNKQR